MFYQILPKITFFFNIFGYIVIEGKSYYNYVYEEKINIDMKKLFFDFVLSCINVVKFELPFINVLYQFSEYSTFRMLKSCIFAFIQNTKFFIYIDLLSHFNWSNGIETLSYKKVLKNIMLLYPCSAFYLRRHISFPRCSVTLIIKYFPSCTYKYPFTSPNKLICTHHNPMKIIYLLKKTITFFCLSHFYFLTFAITKNNH